MIEWIKGHEVAILWVSGASIIIFIATLVAVLWLVVRIPSDYFSYHRRVRKLLREQNLVVRWLILSAKSLLGFIMIITGVVLLFIPGQGMPIILIGIILIDFPGKYRFERWLITLPPVLRSINRLRRCTGRPPLQIQG